MNLIEEFESDTGWNSEKFLHGRLVWTEKIAQNLREENAREICGWFYDPSGDKLGM